MNNTTGEALVTTREEEFGFFDRLPWPVREAMRYADGNVSSKVVFLHLRRGVPQKELIAAIQLWKPES